MTTTIVLAEDHHIVRQGLRALLSAEADFSIEAEASTGPEALKTVEEVKPDVLVLDLMMNGMNGLEVTRQVCRYLPNTKVVILSMYGDEAYVVEALQAGAMAYVLKDSSPLELTRAIREAAAGHRYLGRPLSERALEVYMSRVGASTDPYDSLTERERQVLHLAANGCTGAQIASQLYISRRTVEVHRSNAMKKLGLHSQNDLIRYALRRGILPATEAARG